MRIDKSTFDSVKDTSSSMTAKQQVAKYKLSKSSIYKIRSCKRYSDFTKRSVVTDSIKTTWDKYEPVGERPSNSKWSIWSKISRLFQ